MEHLTASDPPIWYQQTRGLAVNATQEEWRPIAGYEGSYEVSNHGRVRSLDRQVRSKGSGYRTSPGVILRQWNHQFGYKQVALRQHGQCHKKHVHSLVLTAFRGPRPAGMVTCHNDGDPANNHIDNLRWDTESSNRRDSVRHGTHPWANKTHCPQRHAYTPENTVLNSRGRRECRQCREDRSRRRRVGRKARCGKS